jgi:hypothetical protein
VQDMQYRGETSYEPGETLEEAESEIGIVPWVDPDTGVPEGDFPRIDDL